MFFRHAFASLLGVLGYASAAFANSCSNVVTLGTYDRSGLIESEYGISAVGTFRIADEEDENKQPVSISLLLIVKSNPMTWAK